MSYRKKMINEVLKAIYESKLQTFSVKTIRRYYEIPSSNKSKINFYSNILKDLLLKKIISTNVKKGTYILNVEIKKENNLYFLQNSSEVYIF